MLVKKPDWLRTFFVLTIIIWHNITGAVLCQHLSFTLPVQFFKEVQTDKAPDIINFNGDYFIAWKEKNLGKLSFSYLGPQYDTASTESIITVPGAQTKSAPALGVLKDRLYLFWISIDGSLKYIISSNEKQLSVRNIYNVTFAKPIALSQGITTATVGDKIIIATHADSKDDIFYSILSAGEDGVFKEATLSEIPDGKSTDYPFVIDLVNSSARFCWHGKDDLIYFADFDVKNNTWSAKAVKGPVKTSISPAIYHVWDTDKLFYIWRGYKKDSRIYYKSVKENENPAGQTALPVYFASDFPVSVCKVDENNFLMTYTGIDEKLYISNFSSYDPANWMEELLHPLSSTKKLRDIVFPGAHDAGMSILTSAGGQQKGTINECNTLTQKLSIESQLNAGIRMFDLRAGTYDKMIYAKHCASDCMQDAIGGGYGERLRNAATAMQQFLLKNRQEIILLSFSHFCERETPLNDFKDSLLKWLTPALIFTVSGQTSIGQLPLKELAGKVIISFETMENPDDRFPSCSIASTSTAFINFVREYAATNDIKKLVEKEKAFFSSLRGEAKDNNLIRLDWQLTQSSSEAPIICNDFEDEKLNPLVNGIMLLANKVNKNKSIIDRSLDGNKYLPITLTNWIRDGIIDKDNKPNILYVDVAGPWITDFCIDLLRSKIYR
jgi:hypothetical protein